MSVSVEVFSEEDRAGRLRINVVVSGASEVEYGGEMLPGVQLTPKLARKLAIALEECAAHVESY
jgi:hypothetical protein